MRLLTRKDSKAMLRPEGPDIVAASTPELRAKMREVVNDGVRELVVDLADVQMVDSAGIGLLISAHNSLHKLGGRFSIVGASKDILDLFRTMRMHQHFSIAGRESEEA